MLTLTAILLVVVQAALALDNELDATPVVSARHGSCKAAGLCCQNKNNTCRGALVADQLQDSDVEKKQLVTQCFCDASCRDIGDCCDDYVESCQRMYKITLTLCSKHSWSSAT